MAADIPVFLWARTARTDMLLIRHKFYTERGYCLNIDKYKKNLKTEIVAGVTSFFAISYIIIINPLILADAGIPVDFSIFATIIISVIGCLLIGFWADAPLVITPGMGVNALFTYTVVGSMGFNWREALAISMAASIIFAFVACSRLSVFFADNIPKSLKCGITAGIGLFLVEIGLEKGGLIVRGTNSLVALAPLQNAALLTIFGLLLSLALYLRKVNGCFFIAIVITSIIGIVMGMDSSLPVNVDLGRLSAYGSVVWQMDFSAVLSFRFWLAVFSMAMLLIFDTMGILEGLLPNKDKFKKSFAGTSIISILSSIFGTSPAIAAAESAAGITSGGRGGMTAITAGIMFFLSLFFVPFLAYVPQAAVAPVIIITGMIMLNQLKNVDFADFTEWFPAFMMVIMIPLSGSVSAGMAFGFVLFPLLKIFVGKACQVNSLIYILGFLFLLDLFFNSSK